MRRAARCGVQLTRLSSISVEELIRACAASSDCAAWEEFVVRFHRPISLSILRIAHQWDAIPQEVVDDLVQETFLKLCADRCRALLDFTIQHPEVVLGFIKKVAANIAHDHFKSLHSQKRGAGQTDQMGADVESEAGGGSLGGQGAIEREVLLEEINRCLESCSAGPDQERDRLMFWLYYQQGMSAKAIAALPTIELTAKGVETAIFRLTRQVREQVVGVRSRNSASPQPGKKDFARQNRIERRS
jgi:RNA polymerase sigma-70 factor (ECF subfamily)